MSVPQSSWGTSPEANQKLYDDWAQKYEEDVRTWGYTMPEDCAKILKKYCPEDRVKDFEVLDAGAGDGLSGKAITDLGFENVTGIDLSPELIKIAQENKIYKKAEVADLSKPLPYADGQFDAITVVGVMTYLEPDGCCLDEFCRVVKPGGLVIFTHRTDKVDQWTDAHEKFISDGKWEKVEITDPLPYLPQNPEYADKIKVIIHVFRVAEEKKAVEYLGGAAGKYTWDDSKTGGSADNLGPVISKYSWADGKRTVSVYVELDDLDAIPDDDIKIESGEKEFTLSITMGGKARTLKLADLNEEIAGSKFTRKKGKNMVVAKLTKKEETSWFKLQGSTGGGGGGGDDDEGGDPMGGMGGMGGMAGMGGMGGGGGMGGMDLSSMMGGMGGMGQ